MSIKQHVVQNGEVSLTVYELGEGPTVLLCHGFPAIAASWRSQMEALASTGYRALAPDMRGYGLSDAPANADQYTNFHTVGDLISILDHLEIAECAVIGHDFGASVAWSAALMRPDRFCAVFGLSVPFLPLGGPSFLDKVRAAGQMDFYMFEQMKPGADGIWENASRTIPSVYYWTSGQAPAEQRWHAFDKTLGLLREPAEPIALAPSVIQETVEAFSRTGFHGALNYYRALDHYFSIASAPFAGATIHQPAAFLTGSTDGLRAFHPSEHDLRKALPALQRYIVLEGIGHWPQLEDSAAVNGAILDFLVAL